MDSTHVVGCHVELFDVDETSLAVDLPALERRIAADRFDLVTLVNPNSPTGKYAELHAFARRLQAARTAAASAGSAPALWVDETYVDYVSDVSEHTASLEPLAGNGLWVVKSLSKTLALAGLRVAYLVGDVQPLRRFVPPWAVSLPAQLAACHALRDVEYYRGKRQEVCARTGVHFAAPASEARGASFVSCRSALRARPCGLS